MNEDIIEHNVEVLTSEEMGEIRSDLDRSKQVPVEIDSRVDHSHNGFYLVTGFQYNQYGKITSVKGVEEEKDEQDGVYESVQVVYFDGEEAGTIGLGLEPENGEMPRRYRKRLDEEEKVFSGPEELVKVLEQTEEKIRKTSWKDIELE